MKAFVTLPTAAGSVVLGVAQIASIEPGGMRGQNANVRMGNGVIFEALASIDTVLDLIAEATQPELFAEPKAAPPPPPLPITPGGKEGPIGAAMQAAVVKRRGRPPKGTS